MVPIEKPSSSSGRDPNQKPDPFRKPSFLFKPDFVPRPPKTPPKVNLSQSLYTPVKRSGGSPKKPDSSPNKPRAFSWLGPLTASAPKKTPAPGSAGPGSVSPGKSKPGSSLFSGSSSLRRRDFIREAAKTSFGFRGKRSLTFHEKKKILDEALPSSRFHTYISGREVEKRLRELKSEEHKVQSSQEKSRLKSVRKYLEKGTGLKGKYW